MEADVSLSRQGAVSVEGMGLTTVWLRSESLKKFEVLGGLVSGTEESRGKISLDRPNRQWDYPYAW